MEASEKVAVELSRAINREEINQQVQRILEHSLFHQSKRLPMFLRYIVRDSLDHGDAAATKERTLGVEVFGRKPDYDNNLDPIVRVTATELRKKLAQYYYEDGHSDEIRVEIPPGSYMPRFRRPATQLAQQAQESETAQEVRVAEVDTNPAPSDDLSVTALKGFDKVLVPAPLIIGKSGASRSLSSSSLTKSRSFRWPIVAASVLLIFGVWSLLWRQAHPPLSLFWAQFAKGPNPVIIVMPVIGSDDIRIPGVYQRNVSAKPNLSIEDTSLAVRIVSQLEGHQGRYELVSSSDVTLDRLRAGPAVLIGALDNVWTMRLTQDLPLVFVEDADNKTGRIIETAAGSSRSWSVDIDKPHSRINRDYGIVARYRDRLTAQPTVVIAGISSQGTQAAGELLTSSGFESIMALASKSANFEILVETQAVDGHAGPPQIVTSKTW